MPALKKLAGRKFGKWAVVSRADSDTHGARWNCLCDCGTKRIVKSASLLSGASKSCGCIRATQPGNFVHGHNRDGRRTPTYQTWRDMKRRCEDVKHRNYKTYGGKGITVCKRWGDFVSFLADMGERPDGCSLDRVDSNKNYKPSNCRWATHKQQANNMSRNHHIEYKGQKKTLSEWADHLGMPYNRLNTRIHRGWSIERAFTT